MNNNELDKLKKRLYTKGESFEKRSRRDTFYGTREKKPNDYWEKPKKKKFGYLRTILILSFSFIIFATLAFINFWYSGENVVSQKNINIDIKAPTTISGGEIFSFDVFIENRNNANLEIADLVIYYPEGAFSIDGKELIRKRYPLGLVNSGTSVKQSIDMVLFGQEEETKTVKASLEYRLSNSNAIFVSDSTHSIQITKQPIDVLVSLPEEANNGQDINMEIEISSNADTITKNLVLKLAYPTGFQFTSASPSPNTGNNIWKIGDMESFQERKIAIQGIIEGQDTEGKAFQAQVGTINEEGSFIPYGSSIGSLTVKRTSVNLALFINGEDSSDNIANKGDSMRGELVWKNNLPTIIKNASIEVKFKGDAVGAESISATQGSYRVIDKTLIWNSSKIPALASIQPGQTGRVFFSFSISDPLPAGKNLLISIEGQVRGDQIQNNIIKNIKVGSNLQLTTRSLHYTGQFSNTGPMPPQINNETTYTIIWSLTNEANTFSDVKVISTLPAYVRWIGNVSPTDENINFNMETGEIVWEVNNVSPGTGTISSAKEVAFQIGFSPNLGHIGQMPELMTQANLEGRDNFTGTRINKQKPPLTTSLSSDPQFVYIEGIVVSESTEE